ncbi:unnamed protein product [Arctia plantaginis]|uniref:Uncharacterized protein n=1 Tax=Arctia plantaginis TaxID=874455 RepID=A0A8S0Z3K5_ARCPL|nr:unnamed protein product [Arctia plantaginis]
MCDNQFKMAAEITAEFKEKALMKKELANNLAHVDEAVRIAPGILARDKPWEKPDADASPGEVRREEDPTSSSSYTLASDQSLYSHQVDSWLRGGLAPTENIGVQLPRLPFAQRPNLAPTSSLDPTGLWYLMAMILPLFSINTGGQWSWCTPETVINAGELLLAHISRFCHEARVSIRRVATEQLARDFFATIMDVVLIIYAIGFLILSLYQACFFD